MAGTRRILITDCNKPVIRMITEATEEFGAEYQIMKDGEKCLEAIKSFQPDLIIFDIAASKIHGMEFLRRLRSEKTTKNIGVIVTTPHAVAQDYNMVINEGANYCLLKPFSKEKIHTILKQFYEGTLNPGL